MFEIALTNTKSRAHSRSDGNSVNDGDKALNETMFYRFFLFIKTRGLLYEKY
jgi:hypothetical protein